MPIERVRLLSLLVISSAFTALMSGDFELVLFSMLVCSAVPLWFPIDLDRIREHRLWRLYGIVTLMLVCVLFALRFPIKISVFLLVLFCIVYEFYGERRKNAPTRLITLLSFLVVLYQARIESGLNLFFGVLIYIFAIVWCLYAFHAGQIHGFAFRPLVRLATWPALKITSVVVLLGLGIFWLLPRLPEQTLSAIPSLSGGRISGFSGRVSLNDIRSLKLSRKHVLDLKPLSGTLHTRYLKGRVLDAYENGVWSASMNANYYPQAGPGLLYQLRDTHEQTYAYEVDVEALHGNTVFVTDTVQQIKGLPQPVKIMGGTDHISVMRSFPLALSYSFTASAESLPVSHNIALRNYLQQPRSLRYFHELSNSLVDRQDDPRTKIRKCTEWLKRDFKYSLDIHNEGSKDPLYTFLYKSKAGHCELFASALVMLLRAQGIHARLVTGFYIPDPHPSGTFYYITESDAHAWVEAMVDERWLLVDPTPTSAPPEPNFGETQMAYLKHFWRSKIMTYNYDRQAAAFAGVKNFATRLGSSVKTDPRPPLLALTALILFIWLRRHRPVDKQVHLTRLFIRLDTYLQRRFGPREAGIPRFSYARALPLSPPYRDELLRFLERYHHFRFGPDPSSADLPELIGEGRLLLARLKKDPTIQERV